jgi:transcriptional antiterminator RfaH
VSTILVSIGAACLAAESFSRANTGAHREASLISWYALYTKAGHEKRGRAQLRAYGIEAFLPSFSRLTRWGARGDLVRIETPLFPGYLFARFDADEMLATVRNMHGLSQVLGPGNRPASIPGALIAALKRATADPSIVSPADYSPHYAQGDRVTVTNGPLASLTGTVERTAAGGRRLIITIDILQRACAVELRESEVLKAL